MQPQHCREYSLSDSPAALRITCLLHLARAARHRMSAGESPTLALEQGAPGARCLQGMRWD